MPIRKKLFHLSELEVNQVLFADNSDDEEGLVLDDEDLQFLEQDVEGMQETSEISDTLEVTIEPPQENHQLDVNQNSETNSEKAEEVNFIWKKPLPAYQKSAYEETNFVNDFPFGKILIENELNGDVTPYSVFEAVSKFTSFIADIVIPQTILYSQQNGHVFTTNIDEMKAFFGMHLVMGYHTLPSLRDYWSTEPDLGVPFISNVMNLKRFEELRRYLHFNDNSEMGDRKAPGFDRAFKIRPVLKHFNECFLLAMQPTKFQAIDEHMIRFKGHNIMRQFVKGKPIQWGFKVWCRCDSKSGYLFEFDLYMGKKLGAVQYGLGESVVLNLSEKLERLGCQLFIDNYFNSPMLQVVLYGRKIFSAGTVRTNRKHLPKKSESQEAKMKKGDSVSVESHHVFFTKWMDSKPVNMLSNFLAIEPTQEVKRRVSGFCEKQNISCPAVVKQYNEFMGGVDIMDQKKVTYQYDHRAKTKYYLRVVFDLIDIAVNNSAVVYEKFCVAHPETKKLDLKTYRRVVARCLIADFCSRKRNAPTSSVHRCNKIAKYMKPLPSAKHTMQKGQKRSRCKECSKHKRDIKTNNFCVECNVFLCFVNGRDCFAAYHK